MLKHKPIKACLYLLAGMLISISSSNAEIVNYDLTFQTNSQSIWDSGRAFELSETTFLGAQWQNKQVGFDAIVGNEDTNVFNPLRATYDVAFSGCTGLGFSASACINGQSARVPVPRLGSRPSVRSCGRFAVGCNIARAADLTRRAAYDVAFNSCKALGNSSSVCRNGRAGRAPVVALGNPPPQYLEVDTRTGAALTGTSDGRVGIELGLEVGSGAVDATVAYDVSFELPDTTLLNKSDAINFNPLSELAGESTLETTFPGLSLSVDAIMELSGSVFAEGCIIGPGCATGGGSYNIQERASILSFNEDGEGGIELLGLTPSDVGLNPALDGFPFEFEAGGIATTTFHLPQPNTSGGLNATGDKLVAEGQDDLIDLSLDLDNIVSSAAGLPGLFGTSADLPFGSLSYDIIDVSMGPTIDIKQEFELDPTLFVSLAFDKAVDIGGNIVTELVSTWDALPSIKFLDDITEVTPTFFVEAELQNETLLDFDLELGIDLLQIGYDFGLLGDGSFGIGDVLSAGADLFESPNLYDNLFPLLGFDLQVGDSFVVDFLNGSRGPQSQRAVSNVNQIVAPSIPGGNLTNNVSSPSGMLALLLSGLTLLVLRRKFKK